jgi:hypothetical protein
MPPGPGPVMWYEHGPGAGRGPTRLAGRGPEGPMSAVEFNSGPGPPRRCEACRSGSAVGRVRRPQSRMDSMVAS